MLIPNSACISISALFFHDQGSPVWDWWLLQTTRLSYGLSVRRIFPVVKKGDKSTQTQPEFINIYLSSKLGWYLIFVDERPGRSLVTTRHKGPGRCAAERPGVRVRGRCTKERPGVRVEVRGDAVSVRHGQYDVHEKVGRQERQRERLHIKTAWLKLGFGASPHMG